MTTTDIYELTINGAIVIRGQIQTLNHYRRNFPECETSLCLIRHSRMNHPDFVIDETKLTPDDYKASTAPYTVKDWGAIN